MFFNIAGKKRRLEFRVQGSVVSSGCVAVLVKDFIRHKTLVKTRHECLLVPTRQKRYDQYHERGIWEVIEPYLGEQEGKGRGKGEGKEKRRKRREDKSEARTTSLLNLSHRRVTIEL